MELKESRTMRVLGSFATIFGLFGLWYNGLVQSDLSWHTPDPGQPYFTISYISMSAYCVACYVLLVVSGVQLIRLKPRWLAILVLVLVAEILFQAGIGILWRHPNALISHSVAGATGVSGGGMSPQLFTFFPLWGIYLAMRTRKTTGNGTPNQAL